MAQVHNAYYNSPWIAQAAQNLASALAPPDPEKQLAAQRAKWMFEREQQLAQFEDQERQRVADLRGAFGTLATAATGRDTIQAADPSFGALSQLAGALPMGMGKGITEGLGQVQNLGDVVSGTTKDNATREAYRLGASPDDVYAVTGQKTKDAMALAGYKGDLAQVLQEMKGANRLEGIGLQQGGANYRSDSKNALAREMGLSDNQFDLLMTIIKTQGGLDEARIRDANGGPPLDISPTDTMNMGYELEDWAASLNVKLPPDQLYVAKTIAARVYQDTRDSQAAMDAAKIALFGTVTPTVNEGNPDSGWVPNAFGIDTVQEPSFTVRGGMTPQQILEEFQRGYKGRAGAPAAGAVPGATANFSDSFYRANPGMLPQGVTFPGTGLPPASPPRVRVDANGNVIR